VQVEVLESVTEVDAADISRLVADMSSRVTEVSPERVRQVAGGRGSCVIVARLDGRVVGTATLLSLETLVGAFGYVEEVAVDVAVRGRGIGTALMSGLVEAARDRGHDFVELTSRPSVRLPTPSTSRWGSVCGRRTSTGWGCVSRERGRGGSRRRGGELLPS
jgi:ribosomal protein S18 acetylase RimI-like enzyme